MACYTCIPSPLPYSRDMGQMVHDYERVIKVLGRMVIKGLGHMVIKGLKV